MGRRIRCSRKGAKCGRANVARANKVKTEILAPGLPRLAISVAHMEEKTRHLFLIMISIALMYGVALGQTSSTPPQAILPSPLSLDGLSGEGQATSNQGPAENGRARLATCEYSTQLSNLRGMPLEIRRQTDPWPTLRCRPIANSISFLPPRIRRTHSCPQVFKPHWPRQKCNGPSTEVACRVGRSDSERV